VVNCTPGSALRGLKVSTLEAEFPVQEVQWQDSKQAACATA
jgi:hypothetical protein